MGPAQALTGPIARGDVKTIRCHLRRIELIDPGLASLYRAIGRYAVNVAIRKGTITPSKAQEIMESLLTSGIPSLDTANIRSYRDQATKD